MPLDEDEEHARYDTGAGRAPTSRRQPRRRWSWPRSGRRTGAAPRRSTPGGDRSTWRSTCSPARRRSAVAGLHHAQRDGRPGGRRRLVAGRPRYPQAAFYAYAHPAPDGFASANAHPAGGALGRRAGRVHPRLGRRPGAAPTRRPASSSPVRRSATPAWCAMGSGAGGERRGQATARPVVARTVADPDPVVVATVADPDVAAVLDWWTAQAPPGRGAPPGTCTRSGSRR